MSDVIIALKTGFLATNWIKLADIFRACIHGVEDPGLVGLVSFVFTLWRIQNQKKLTPLDWGPPLHVNRVSDNFQF